jgi:hypothetical protein
MWSADVRKGKITSHRLLPEGEQPLPTSKQSADRFGQKDKYDLYLCQFQIVFLHQERVNADLSRCKCRSSDKVKSGVAENTIDSWNAENDEDK